VDDFTEVKHRSRKDSRGFTDSYPFARMFQLPCSTRSSDGDDDGFSDGFGHLQIMSFLCAIGISAGELDFPSP